MENNLKYFVDAEKGIVICQLTDCRWNAENRIDKYLNPNRFYDYKGYLIPNTFTGVARCNLTEDTFDEEYGKKLALTRAKRKRGQAINTCIKNFLSKTRRKLYILEKYGIHEVPEVK